MKFVMNALLTTCLVAGALILSTPQAQAGSRCEIQDAKPFLPMQAAKRAFFDMDAKAIKPLFMAPVELSSLENLVSQASAVAPNGFATCRTILQRVDAGGMVQEVSHYISKSGDVEVFLYVLAFPGPKGDLGLRSINFNTDFDVSMTNVR